MVVSLQPGAVDNLVVDGELATSIVDDKDTDGTTAVGERVAETVQEAALVKDGKTLLDGASLGHGDDTAVFTNVEHTVLLEDRAEHVLDNDRRAGVRGEGGLLEELLGEQVDTQVAVLASGSRGGDTDDLARTALQDQEITDADVVAGDGDGVGRIARALREADRLALNRALARTADIDLDINLLITAAAEGMADAVGNTVSRVTEGVVVAVFV